MLSVAAYSGFLHQMIGLLPDRVANMTSFETAGIPCLSVGMKMRFFFSREPVSHSLSAKLDFTERTNRINYVHVVIAMLGQRQRCGNERSNLYLDSRTEGGSVGHE